MTSNQRHLDKTLLSALCVALLSLFGTRPAAAQEDAHDTSPMLRLDIDVPSLSIGASTLDGADAGLSLGVGLRLAHRSGHGGFVAASMYDGDPALDILGPSPAHSAAWLVDAGYLHRLRLAGDDRVGLGLDIEGGLSGGRAQFYQPTSGCFFSPCTPPAQVEENVADGAYIGPSVGGSLDLRAWGFTMGIDIRYRALFALDRAEPTDRLDQHVFTAGLHLGFGIY